MKFHRCLPSAVLFFMFLLCLPAAATREKTAGTVQLRSMLGWIPMQPVIAGEMLELDLRRFYFAKPGVSHRLVLPDSKPGEFEAGLDAAAYWMAVRVDRKASGLLEVPLQVFEQPAAAGLGRKVTDAAVTGDGQAGRPLLEGVLTIAVQPADGHTFTYRDMAGSARKVAVAGHFNGWNTDSHQLRPVGDRWWELFVRLPPGSHPYRLVVDGKSVADPANPEKITDGAGHENSLARVGSTGRSAPPVVYAAEAADGRCVFRIVPGGAAIVQVSSVLQLPGGDSRLTGYEREGDTVTVEVPDAPEGSWVRVAVADRDGNVSNAARVPARPLTEFQWQDGIIYHTFTDRFANGDESNDRPVDDERVAPAANYQGGDFQGIQRKIEEGYFRDLGVNVLRLAPINRNPEGAWQQNAPPHRFYTGYHGHWPVSHHEVEPRFGGGEALHSMITRAHDSEIKVIADLVLKHVHQDHPMWTEQRGLFGGIDLPARTKNLNERDGRFGLAAWFEEWLPRFDFDNPEARKFLIGNAVDFALRFNLDGYRLEAVEHVKHEFWWTYRTALNTAVQPRREALFYNVGGTFMDRGGIAGFVGPNMLDGQFDFPLYDTIIDVFAKEHQGMDELERSLEASEMIYGKETLMSPLVGNQDKARFMAYADGDLPDPEYPDEVEAGYHNPPQVDNVSSYDKLKLALTFILSIDGVPMIYYGDEIGLTGAGDPDNRRFMPWEGLLPEQEAVRKHLSQVAKTRQAHPALRYGSRRPLVAEGNRYAFVRAHLDDRVLAVWNRGSNQTEFSLGVAPEMVDGLYLDAISGREIEVKDGRTSFKLEPMKSALFVPKRS
jgi:cyclomaltodextrinase / maltogenic alpha-amylase / neopullulanase